MENQQPTQNPNSYTQVGLSPIVTAHERQTIDWLDPDLLELTSFPGANTVKYNVANDPDIIVRINRGGYVVGWQNDHSRVAEDIEQRKKLYEHAKLLRGFGVSIPEFDVLFVQPVNEDLRLINLEKTIPTNDGVYVDSPDIETGVDIYYKVPFINGVRAEDIELNENTLSEIDKTYSGLIQYYTSMYGADGLPELLADISELGQFVYGTLPHETEVKLWLVDIDIHSYGKSPDTLELEWLVSAFFESQKYPNPANLELRRVNESIKIAIETLKPKYPRGIQWLLNVMDQPDLRAVDYDDIDKLY